MIIQVNQRQNSFDIAIINFGSAEQAYVFCYLNGISASSIIAPGQHDMIAAEVTNRRVVNFYASKQIMPATSPLEAEGIFDNTFDNTFE